MVVVRIMDQCSGGRVETATRSFDLHSEDDRRFGIDDNRRAGTLSRSTSKGLPKSMEMQSGMRTRWMLVVLVVDDTVSDDSSFSSFTVGVDPPAVSRVVSARLSCGDSTTLTVSAVNIVSSTTDLMLLLLLSPLLAMPAASGDCCAISSFSNSRTAEPAVVVSLNVTCVSVADGDSIELSRGGTTPMAGNSSSSSTFGWRRGLSSVGTVAAAAAAVDDPIGSDGSTPPPGPSQSLLVVFVFVFVCCRAAINARACSCVMLESSPLAASTTVFSNNCAMRKDAISRIFMVVVADDDDDEELVVLVLVLVLVLWALWAVRRDRTDRDSDGDSRGVMWKACAVGRPPSATTRTRRVVERERVIIQKSKKEICNKACNGCAPHRVW